MRKASTEVTDTLKRFAYAAIAPVMTLLRLSDEWKPIGRKVQD